ncbi:hypothetical protein [Paenarthrobacter histidinolovorans]|uniref:hypothetical protein n=1 Tax=Paenarthrobacter histidinolovorans TaxID=43664 RepID=UPI0016629DC6|nr:hypothetical protein [Paenarthrobacter histidinolovorans]GGJ32107.1 hypothetical protein GCM10010052_31240 [Paenarthrobacter histidinolovorans]
MAGVPDHPARDAGWNEPEYEVIGGGLVDDQPRAGQPGPGSEPPRGAVVKDAAGDAWRDARKSFSSWLFWLSCCSGVAFAGGTAAGLVAWVLRNGWIENAMPEATFVVMAAFLGLPAAMLGIVWGYRHIHESLLVMLLAGSLRGLALSLLALPVLLVVGISSGGPLALAVAAVVVVVLEVALFGLMGAGSRACFATTVPGVALATVLAAFFCAGNVALTVLLLPGTTDLATASVPVNVERDDAGGITAYECVGSLHQVEVAHTERVAWLAASHPALLLASFGGEFVPPDNNVAWVLSGLQFAADGPSREVPCLGGVSSDGLTPPVPVALSGFAVQAAVAALVAVGGRRLGLRRLRA